MDIAEELRLTRGPGGGLWFDAGGVFRSGAENLVADLVREVLGSEFRANRLQPFQVNCDFSGSDIFGLSGRHPRLFGFANR